MDKWVDEEAVFGQVLLPIGQRNRYKVIPAWVATRRELKDNTGDNERPLINKSIETEKLAIDDIIPITGEGKHEILLTVTNVTYENRSRWSRWCKVWLASCGVGWSRGW